MKKIIGIDFDGTCVTHEYPNVGRDIGAQKVLKRLVDAGHSLMLWTMRSGAPLNDAKIWFEKNNLPLFGVNNNPHQHTWTSSKKQYAHLYIDDAALGCPLINDEPRPYADWNKIEEMLEAEGYFKS